MENTNNEKRGYIVLILGLWTASVAKRKSNSFIDLSNESGNRLEIGVHRKHFNAKIWFRAIWLVILNKFSHFFL